MKTQLLNAFVAVILSLMPNLNFGQVPDLGAASAFVLFTKAGAFNNTGATYATGDIGSNSASVTGFPPGIVAGTIYNPPDPVLAEAATDVGLAYTYLSGLPCGLVIGSTLGSGQVLFPNVYCPGDASTLTGDLTLNGEGDCNALFIFKINGEFSTSTNSNVLLLNGAQVKNVYWQINGAFTLGGGSVFRGTVIAGGAITLNTGAALYGRALTTAGAINIDVITATITQNVWDGSASEDWNTAENWSLGIVPGCSLAINAVIPTGATPYPVISSTANYTDNLIIQNGATLTINSGKDLTVCGCTEINGPDALILQSGPNNSGNATFIDNGTITYPNNGSVKIELYLSDCTISNGGCWHYISPPVTSALAQVFLGDYLKYYDEVAGAWSNFITSESFPLKVMQGYIVSNNGTVTRVFQGEVNTGNLSELLSRTTPPPQGGYGWNLAGNPYPSPLDLESPGITWNNIEKKVWYYSKFAENYKPYVVGGLANPGTRYCPSMQGFFVHVPSGYNAETLQVTNVARTTARDTSFYKSTRSINDLIWLKVEESRGMNDEVVIYFRPDATSGYDKDFDCQKLNGTAIAPQLYAVSSDDSRLTIDVLPFAGINTSIPLEFSVSSEGTGNYSMTASKLESFRAGTKIRLEDKKESKTQELTENPVYNFSYNEGDNPSRFILHFFNPFYGIDDHDREDGLLIYSSGKDVYLKNLTGNPEKGEMFIYNTLGLEITQKSVSAISLNKYTFNLPDGYYIVSVVTSDKTYNNMVFLD